MIVKYEMKHNTFLANTFFGGTADPNTESRLFILNLNIYVPKDERFSQVKFSDFIGYALKAVGQVLAPEIKAVFDKTINEFDELKDVLSLYENRLSEGHSLDKIRDCVPWELLRELLRSDGERFLKFPVPEVIKGNKFTLLDLPIFFLSFLDYSLVHGLMQRIAMRGEQTKSLAEKCWLE